MIVQNEELWIAYAWMDGTVGMVKLIIVTICYYVIFHLFLPWFWCITKYVYICFLI